ncbi:MAG: ATP-dependent helicase HrpB [Hyphomicrobiales bacterium]
MRIFETRLPIDDVLTDCLDALEHHSSAVLVAPPGAGKTTRVPLALLDASWREEKKIVVLEPRRLAARGAAARMASTLGEAVGDTVGYRVRLQSKISARTRIEVITEGIFTRMILDDPSLSSVAAVLFDEFHERSLDADLGLALALDAQQALRPDLRILAMSATLDGARVATLLGQCPVIESEGRAFPIETFYRPRDPSRRIEDSIVDVIRYALAQDEGSILVFLPGQSEIKRTEDLLRDKISSPSIEIAPLYGAMDVADQDKAISPARPGIRKIVLATSIAETSLTIDGVRVVIDSGLQRIPVYEPDLGLTRLETRRVSRASADQRRGRAGRTEPGVCYRLWEEAATGALEPFSAPEILAADLSGLMLDCAEWGVTDPTRLAFLDPPPKPALNEARATLNALEALDEEGRITATGHAIRALPLPPRLARMIVTAGARGKAYQAAEIAALMSERGMGGTSSDLTHRLEQFHKDRSRRADDVRRLAKSWADTVSNSQSGIDLSTGALLALAFPDRIAKARGAPGSFLMANGRAARVEPHDALARESYLAIGEIAGSASDARILLSAPLTLSEIETEFEKEIISEASISFDRNAAQLRATKSRRLGALIFSEQRLPVPASDDAARVLARGLGSLGVAQWPLSKATRQWRDRILFLRRTDIKWPDLSDETLEKTAEDWLAPFLIGKTGLSDLDDEIFRQALNSLMEWPMQQRVEAEAPAFFTAPTSNRHAIDYEAEEGPVLAIRVQELFGLETHPSVAQGRIPLVLHLLSPAHRPIQITRDLPGFWKGSWAAVKSEMKGRYPKHVWPDDPAKAQPTTRAKPRGT